MNPSSDIPAETGHEEVECRLQNSPRGQYPVTGDGKVLGFVAMEGVGPKCPQRSGEKSDGSSTPLHYHFEPNELANNAPQVGSGEVVAVHYAYAPPPESGTEIDARAFGMADAEDFLEDVDTPKASPMDNLGGELFGGHLYRPISAPSRPIISDTYEELAALSQAQEYDGYNVHSAQPDTWMVEGDDMPAFEGDMQEPTSSSSALAAMLGQGTGTAGRGARNPPAQLFKQDTDGSLPSTASYGSVPGHMSLLRPQVSLGKQATSGSATKRCTPRTPFWSMPQGLGRTGAKTPARGAPFSCLDTPLEDGEIEFEVPENEIMTVPLRTKEQRVDWRDFLCEMVATKKASSLFLLYDVEADPPRYARPPPADPKRYQAVGGVAWPPTPEMPQPTEQRSAMAEGVSNDIISDSSLVAQAPSSLETVAQRSSSDVQAPPTTTTEDYEQIPVHSVSSELPSPLDEPSPAPPPQTLVAAEDSRQIPGESPEEEIPVASGSSLPPRASTLPLNSSDLMGGTVSDGL